ncbi:hypothetical protein ACQKP0_15955 [Heyndrickxia sp. NPDC080065]|uniref:hypothetical protein n=1 Tax=Heyndrickxia sp. NPDC080065 TaxID=3390568 RepID=UPI003CFE540B
MTIEEKLIYLTENILYNESINLPKNRTDDNFIGFIKAIFDEYIVLLSASEITQPLLSEINTLTSGILSVYEEYFKGFPHKAYHNLDHVLGNIKTRLERFGTQPMEHSDNNFYRIRTGSNHAYTMGELFHIPFEKREMVNSQRYSIPGFPSLYLGNSVMVCWEEMGRPDLLKTQAVRLSTEKRKFSYIDLGYPPHIYNSILRDILFQKKKVSEDLLHQTHDYLVCWPLIAACSIHVKNKEAPFKPEYIIPQLLLQWVRNSNQFDCIRYFSVHTETNLDNHFLSFNYVFPVKSSNEKGYCKELIKLFKMTEPISTQYMFTIIGDSEKELIRNQCFNKDAKLYLGLRHDAPSFLYRNTDFALIEGFLNYKLPLNNIRN